jgi:hypothetical protein
MCERNAMAGVQLCQSLAPGDPSACAEVCLEDYRQAHALPPLPPSLPGISASTGPPPPPPTRPPDPFVLALGECVQRVRDGEAEPACRFFRPLDEMDFGQKHCDAKCAELTEGYRASRATSGP